jgi:hypothetical protein
VIAGAPTWFIVAGDGRAVPGARHAAVGAGAVAKQPRIVMDARIGAEQMDRSRDRCRRPACRGRPVRARQRLAPIEAIVVTIEGDASSSRCSLAARYGNVTLGITGEDPESARYCDVVGRERSPSIAISTARRRHARCSPI